VCAQRAARTVAGLAAALVVIGVVVAKLAEPAARLPDAFIAQTTAREGGAVQSATLEVLP
jgi:hypothetical protein